MNARLETINKLKKGLQWGKLTDFLEDVVETSDAYFEDYSGYILSVVKTQNSKKYPKAVNCLIKVQKIKESSTKDLRFLYKQSEPMLSSLGLKYFDDKNSNSIDEEFYLQTRVYLFLQAKKFNDSINCLNQLINKYKKPQYYFQRSKLYAISKKYKESLEDLNSAIKINSKESIFFYNRAILKNKLHDNSGAYIDMGSAIELEPDNSEYYYFRGVIASSMQRYKNAIDDLKKAIKISPQDIKLYQETANCLQNTDKIIEAFSVIAEALEINPNDASNYFIRGTLYNQQKKYEEAIQDFDKALKTDNYSDKRWVAKIFYQRAWAEFKIEKYKEAQTDITQALKYDDKTLAYYYLGMDIEVFGTKDFYNARGYCNKILQKFPNNQRAISAQEEILKLKK